MKNVSILIAAITLLASTSLLAQTSCEGGSFVCGNTIAGVLTEGACPTGCLEYSQSHSFNVFGNTTLTTLTVTSTEFNPAIEIVRPDDTVIDRREGDGSGSTRLAIVLKPGIYKARVIGLPPGSSGAYSLRLTCLIGDPQVFCSPDESTLCFESRFSVRAAIRASESSPSVIATALRSSDRHGHFSAPSLTNDAANPELVVKILDGRAINGRWWIFLGSLTGFDYDITVRDTFFKRAKTYTKADVVAGGGVDLITFTDQ